jgi:hypothetical protein
MLMIPAVLVIGGFLWLVYALDKRDARERDKTR